MSPLSYVMHNQFKDTSFASLMTKRIFNVLLFATKYDVFILEDDGRVDEQIFDEYTSLNLRYPPRFTQVFNEKEALQELKQNRYELIIFMPNMDDVDIFGSARKLKKKHPDVPLVILTPFSKEVSKRLSTEDVSFADYVFSWMGNSNLLLAIIKLIEDSMNVEHDTQTVGVEVILLVEDSVRFYSTALPILYKIILNESKEFAKEALNEHQRMLRMRGRPKIMLARTYEEAVEVYKKYKNNVLGVITDMSYQHEGVKEKLAGYYLAQWLKSQDKYLPVIFNSSDAFNEKYATELGCCFIDKNSNTYPLDLKKEVFSNFGFGDFIIINPHTKEEIMRITNLKALQKSIMEIPAESLLYHMSHNHFSRFFYSRAMFPIAETLKKFEVDDLGVETARRIIYDSIVEYRRMKNSGVIASFDKDRFDEFSNFARIGDASIGGKGRGLAFMGNMVKTHLELNIHEKFPIVVPKTVVLATDIFDEFMEANNLYPIALSERTDDEILSEFLKAKLPERLSEDFNTFLDAVKKPLAVRSSSLLEDSYYQPFAGIYSTYMIPYLQDNVDVTLLLLSSAVKAVYASVFYADSKAYMKATQNVIDQEKMAIVLQEVAGTNYGNHFYPTISGVARSLNYYPIGDEKPEDGVVNMALGLGKYIVDGGVSLRFSPCHPNKILQLSDLDIALKDTQRKFYALDLNCISKEFSKDDAFNLLNLNLKDAENDDSIRYIASTFDPNDQVINDGYYPGGRKVITFANILQHEQFPLSETLNKILQIAQEEMGRAIEIEFAVDVKNTEYAEFYLLQIRPIIQNKEMLTEDLSIVDKQDIILFSQNALGNGVEDNIQDIVYVKSDGFNAYNNQEVAYEIEKLNKQFVTENKEYVLIGPGRWGSSDTWLGIPVKWPHICNAKLLVELALNNYQIEPSQGTHFFQNLTSLGVGYFTINPQINDEYYDEDFLNSHQAIYESKYIRHIRFNKSTLIKINGRKKQGILLKP